MEGEKTREKEKQTDRQRRGQEPGTPSMTYFLQPSPIS
jgi:hypothetical protein